MKRFFRNLFASKAKQPSAKPRKSGFKPQMEALEDRLVPANLLVRSGMLKSRPTGLAVLEGSAGTVRPWLAK